jgi:dual specificity tyrosine-phosphorylation-regulated kinase 2/3/4
MYRIHYRDFYARLKTNQN